MSTYKPVGAPFVRGEGSWLFDDNGKRYLDLLCGIAVTSLGHCHPKVVAALNEQAGRLWHVSNLFNNEIGPALAECVDGLVSDAITRVGRNPGIGTEGTQSETGDRSQVGFGKVFLANSGAEANECAIKLARKFSSRRRLIVTLKGSFHGRTIATLAATGQPSKHEPFLPLPPDFAYIEIDDSGTQAAISALEKLVSGGEVAAVMVEGIRGEGEVRDVPVDFLVAARRLCDQSGALLIFDEIQTGLGRTGRWFSFEHAGIAPDLVTLAKALGNGMPIGCCWAREDIAEAFRPGDHGSTFGGQPIACSAALATVKELKAMDAPARAEAAGTRFREALAAMPAVAELRGKGLLIGVGLSDGVGAGRVVEIALERGVVLNSIGESTLRLAPPINISDDEIEFGLSVLERVLEEVTDDTAHIGG